MHKDSVLYPVKQNRKEISVLFEHKFNSAEAISYHFVSNVVYQISLSVFLVICASNSKQKL